MPTIFQKKDAAQPSCIKSLRSISKQCLEKKTTKFWSLSHVIILQTSLSIIRSRDHVITLIGRFLRAPRKKLSVSLQQLLLVHHSGMDLTLTLATPSTTNSFQLLRISLIRSVLAISQVILQYWRSFQMFQDLSQLIKFLLKSWRCSMKSQLLNGLRL